MNYKSHFFFPFAPPFFPASSSFACSAYAQSTHHSYPTFFQSPTTGSIYNHILNQLFIIIRIVSDLHKCVLRLLSQEFIGIEISFRFQELAICPSIGQINDSGTIA